MNMLHSLFVKLAMLVASIGLVCWVWWQRSDETPGPTVSDDGVTAVTVPLPVSVEAYANQSEQIARPVPAKVKVARKVSGESAIHRLLDLNRADATDFESLPGIGPVLAQRVIEYRTAVGRFQRIDDLTAVKGIGPKIFERIKPLVTVATVESVDTQGKAEKQL